MKTPKKPVRFRTTKHKLTQYKYSEHFGSFLELFVWLPGKTWQNNKNGRFKMLHLLAKAATSVFKYRITRMSEPKVRKGSK